MASAGIKAATVKSRIRKNDTVMVIKGRERGKTGKVLRVVPAENRVVIERLNLVKRHSKARGPSSAGGIVEKEAALQLANVMIMCERCNAPVRIGVKVTADKAAGDKVKTRICRRCGEPLGND
ncbi:MAG TPA: 50S ribosomal protein L24 [Candidatus Binataceae bacterium]|nr:50S ribosomal protein L24 [Candidatus Binataceae bacterium]